MINYKLLVYCDKLLSLCKIKPPTLGHRTLDTGPCYITSLVPETLEKEPSRLFLSFPRLSNKKITKFVEDSLNDYRLAFKYKDCSNLYVHVYLDTESTIPVYILEVSTQ